MFLKRKNHTLISNKVFLERLEKFSSNYPRVINLSLNRIKRLLSHLDNPHLKLPPTIHIAGTNGKGSTIAFLYESLKSAGKKVHVYTSPHILQVTERFVIANKEVSYKKLFETLDYCAKVNKGDPITQFEMLTCIAFLLMSNSKADIALIETGLGGRLDATNVIKNPILTIITSISFDHVDFLGNSLQLIATEKAGIMKKGSICISAPQSEIVEKVLLKESIVRKSKLIVCNKNSIVRYCSDGFEVKRTKNIIYSFPNPALKGHHQIINAALAATSLLLCPKLDISINHIKYGISSATWQGRLELINNGNIKNITPSNCEVWLDGGHNIAGAEAIKNWIIVDKKRTRLKHFILICGFLKNKDVKNILTILKYNIDHVIFVPLIDTKNAYCYKDLSNIAKSINLKFYYKNSIKKALESKYILKDSKILIFGSIYLVGEAIKLNKD